MIIKHKGKQATKRSFEAKVLVLEGLAANISITPGDVETIDLKADKDVLGTLDFVTSRCGPTLHARVKPGQTEAVHVEANQGEDVTVTSLEETFENLPAVEITVPEGTDITLDNCCGKATVGAVDGDLSVFVTSYEKVTAAKVRKLVAKIYGQGSVVVDHVDGDARLAISGRGDIQVKQGKIGHLVAEVPGRGDIRVDTEALDANLEILGIGKIHVQAVKRRLRQQNSGLGSIEVANR